MKQRKHHIFSWVLPQLDEDFLCSFGILHCGPNNYVLHFCKKKMDDSSYSYNNRTITLINCCRLHNMHTSTFWLLILAFDLIYWLRKQTSPLWLLKQEDLKRNLNIIINDTSSTLIFTASICCTRKWLQVNSYVWLIYFSMITLFIWIALKIMNCGKINNY